MRKTLLLLFLIPNLFFAADIIVDSGGGGDYTTIQDAVNNAAAGDTIIVNNGIYNESVNLSTAAGDLIIKSANPLGATVNGGTNPAFVVASGKTAAFEISGFNLDADSGMTTGVLYFNDLNGELVIKDNAFISGFGGDAVRLENTSADINAFIHNNSASGPADNDDFIKVTNNSSSVNLVVDNNTASGFQDDAVGVELRASNVTSIVRVTNNNFSNWTASGQGIDIFCGNGTPPNNQNVHFIVDNNTLTGTDGDSILINADGINTRIYGSITNNTINGNANTNNGINVDGDSTSNGVHLYLNIDTNIISNVTANGINFRPFADDAIRDIWTILVNNNTIDNPNTDSNSGTNPEAAIRLDQSSGVDDENFDINIEVTNNSIVNLNGVTRCISIEQPTTTMVSTAVVNFTESGNSCSTTTEGTVNVVGDAVSNSVIPTNIGNRIWYDDNYNGIQDGGEVGVAGATIRITGGAFDLTTTSDVNGNYILPSLLAGNYTVTLTPPSNYPFITIDNQGADTSDSDFDYTTGIFNVTIVGGSDDLTIDGGVGDVALAITDNELANNLLVYPNPTEGIVNINFNKEFHNLKIETFNVLGQKLNMKEANSSLKLDMSDLKSGIYFLRFISNEKVLGTIRMIKR